MRKYIPHILIITFVFLVVPITSATGGSITLRSHYRSLSVSQVRSMPNVSIRKKYDWGFFGYSTINHDYNLKAVSGDVVVVDNATGLMWHHGGSDDELKWDEARKWVWQLNSKGYAGYHDWRLPTVDEAASLMEPKKNVGKWGDYCIDPVFNKKQSCTWTGDRHSSGTGWAVNFYNSGGVQWSDFTFYYVRPVRSVESW